MKAIILVGLGGGIGSIFRYLTSLYFAQKTSFAFPLGTFAVNIIGCFVIGILFSFFEKQQVATLELRYLFITGFCGGYTTFSAFAIENLILIRDGHVFLAILYAVLSVVIGILMVWLGTYIGK